MSNCGKRGRSRNSMLVPNLRPKVVPHGPRLLPSLIVHTCGRLVAGASSLLCAQEETRPSSPAFTGIEWERHWLERYGALVAATPKNNTRRAWPKADRRWASFARQAPDHRGGDLPAQGLLLSGASSSQNPRRAAGASGGQGCGIHLWTTHQRLPRSTAAPPGRPAGLAHCTSVV